MKQFKLHEKLNITNRQCCHQHSQGLRVMKTDFCVMVSLGNSSPVFDVLQSVWQHNNGTDTFKLSDIINKLLYHTLITRGVIGQME